MPTDTRRHTISVTQFTWHSSLVHLKKVIVDQMATASVIRRYYTPLQVAEVLGISRTQVYRLRDQQEIDAIKVGSVWRISIESVDRYIARLERPKKKGA